jgi:manganese oxidase
MWHSHSEKELTSNNIFPGGMLTFGVVEHWDVTIEPGNP